MADKPFEILVKAKTKTQANKLASSRLKQFCDSSRKLVCKPFRFTRNKKKVFVKGLYECIRK